jgi:hypothetical protein
MGCLAPSSPWTATSRSAPAISRPFPSPPGLSTTTARSAPVTKQTHSQRNPEWQSNVDGRLAPGATGKTDRPLVGASLARTAVRRSTESTTRTFPRYAGLSPSAARSARAGSRERAAAIRARSRAPSSARASLRCCRTSPRAGASAGIAASGPAVARAGTGSGPERRRGPPARWQSQPPAGSGAWRLERSQRSSVARRLLLTTAAKPSHRPLVRSRGVRPQSWEVHIEWVIRCRQRGASSLRVAARSPGERGPRFTDSQLLRRGVVRRERSDILNR